jgi:hypothetical protein
MLSVKNNDADEHRMALMMPILAPRLIEPMRFTLKSQTISNPKPGSYHINMVIVTKANSIFHPWIDGFEAGLSAGKPWPLPFLYITIPKFKAGATITVNQEVKAASQLDYDYTSFVLYTKNPPLYVTGFTKLKLLAFKKAEVLLGNDFAITGLFYLAEPQMFKTLT